MAKAAAAGTSEITVHLRPVELGSIEVKLDFGQDGQIRAAITAEKPQTLELLQRDSRDLEKALQDAGLQTGSNGLSFNLRGQGGGHGQQGRQQNFQQNFGGAARGIDGNDGAAARQFTFMATQGGVTPQGRIDVRV
jgi:flagellar hook-length control protein FliK